MSKIDTSQWQEFKLSTLFSAENGDVDLQKKDINGKGIPVISSGDTGLGIIGTTDLKAKTFPADTITVDMFGSVYYRDFEYKMVTHARVFSLAPIQRAMGKEIGMFLATCIRKITSAFSYNDMCNWNKIKDMTILLPAIETDEPDWDYMAERIQEMEAERIQEMEAYLAASGLDNTELTEEEKQALDSLQGTEGIPLQKVQTFSLEEIFEKIPVGKIKGKAGDFPTTSDDIHVIPLLTAGIENQGLSRYARRDQCPTILSNVISISANGANTGASFYQNDEFAVLQDAYAIKLKEQDIPNEKVGLYLAACLNKLLHGNFDWSNKAGWNNIKHLEITLPIDDSNNMDMLYMQHVVGGTIKQAISRISQWREREIAAAKQIVSQHETRCVSLRREYRCSNVRLRAV